MLALTLVLLTLALALMRAQFCLYCQTACATKPLRSEQQGQPMRPVRRVQPGPVQWRAMAARRQRAWGGIFF